MLKKMELFNTIREKENRDLKHLEKNCSPKHLFYDKEYFIKIAK